MGYLYLSRYFLQNGGTALMNACEGGHLDVVRYLIDQGADINAHRTVSYNVYE